MKEIWVYAECKKGIIASSYYELISKASVLANDLTDAIVCGVVLGKENETVISTLKGSGVSKVYSMEDSLLEQYNAQTYACAFASLIETYKPEMVIVAASAIGSELAPTVAGKIKTGLAAHCVDLRIDPNTKRINCMVPAFGGKVISEIYVPNTRPVMASVKPGILEAEALENKNVSVVSCPSCLVSLEVKEEVIGFDEFVSKGQSLETAPFVLSVGRGVNEEAYEIVKNIAKKMDGTIGYTRSFVDTGMVEDESELIGTSGKSIKPKVLLEFGISGAVHYISGINKSKCIISVNTDENSKIFSYSDYGVVQDAKLILREIEKKL